MIKEKERIANSPKGSKTEEGHSKRESPLLLLFLWGIFKNNLTDKK